MDNSIIVKAIVIGNDHYNTLNAIRALGENGIKVTAIIISAQSHSFVLKSKYVDDGCIVEKPDAETIIRKYGQAGRKIPILATCDAMAVFLDCNYDRLSSHFILPSCGNSQGRLCFYMDKNMQLKHAAVAGFELPSSLAVNLDDAATLDFSVTNYPCIVKPEESIGGSKDDFRICYNEDQLRQSLAYLSSHLSRVLIQDFIPNDEVILIAGVRTLNNKNYVFGEINKLKHSGKPNSLGLNCLGVLSADSELRDACIKLVDAIDYHGCYSVEVVRVRTATAPATKSHNYFMEINLRTDGLFYFYTKAGINLPAIWVKSCHGSNCDVKPQKKNIYGMNEFLYIRNCMSLATVKDLLKTDVFSIFSTKDIKPFLYKLRYNA